MQEQINELKYLDQKERIERSVELVQNLIERQQKDDIITFLQHLIGDEQATLTARPVMLAVSTSLGSLPPPMLKELSHQILDILGARASSTFEEPTVIIRELLSDCYQQEGEFEKAADFLAQNVSLGSSRNMAEAERARIYVKIAKLYMQNRNWEKAGEYNKRAAVLQVRIAQPETLLDFKICNATMLDRNGNFLDAAHKYRELSQVAAEQDRFIYHQKAVICIMLSPAGPRRSNLLNSLYKDERSASLSYFQLLQKLYLSHLVKGDDVAQLASTLEAYQQERLGAAVMEHNILAASRIYSNITFAQLGSLLGVDVSKAEETAATMIIQNRMEGTINQVQGVIGFESDVGALSQWDDQIADICHSVNAIVDGISAKYGPLTA
eukprot:gnl/Trimastix_PCT/1256.p1 GENE.gnl/Trimastix_PCT/1256~~gnl/Trimastix_PCT/1256.p1  ORF type:complete len:382 (-),score=125.41 gnl/Trimastix_PCT/1256:96-1241(-)